MGVASDVLAFLAASGGLVTRVTDTLVTVGVPFISGYEIASVENVSIVLPREAVLTNRTTCVTRLDLT
jgi:hypothetical protein